VKRGCELAFGMPKELRRIPKKLPEAERKRLQQQAAQWRAKYCWSPNQLRHSTATKIRKEFGIEAAQVVLGHSKADVTQVYAERDSNLAANVMRAIG
jgi:site-specific recombinase XerC